MIEQKPTDWKSVFEKEGVFQTGHYKLTSGQHTDIYINFARLLNRPDLGFFREICRSLAGLVRPKIAQKNNGLVFLGTGVGSHYALEICRIMTQQETERAKKPAPKGKKRIIPEVYHPSICRWVFAQRRPDQGLKLPYSQAEILKNSEIVIIDDVHHTGTTFKQLISLCEKTGSSILQYLTIINRSPDTWVSNDIDLNYPVESLLHLPELADNCWPEADCPLCRDKTPFSADYGDSEPFLIGL